MKKGFASGEFEKATKQIMIFHAILLKIQEVYPKWRQEALNVRKRGPDVSKSEPKGA